MNEPAVDRSCPERPPVGAGSLSSDFWKFWIGQTISNLGTSFTLFALPLLVFRLTGSAVNLALSVVAYSLPYLLFGLPIGAWADRVDRRRLMIGADLARAAVIGAVPLLAAVHQLSIWRIYGLAFAASLLAIGFDAAPDLGERRTAPTDREVAPEARAFQTQPGGAWRHDLEIIGSFTHDVAELDPAGGDLLTLEHGGPVIEAGLLTLEAQAAHATGQLPETVLDRIVGDARVATSGDSTSSERSLKTLNHFVDVRGKTVVMETRLARLTREGRRLEREVDALRDAHERWRDWAWATRESIARLERAQAARRARSEHAEDTARSCRPGSLLERLQRWLTGGEPPAGSRRNRSREQEVVDEA